MRNCQKTQPILMDLIQATHLLAKEVERFTSRVEQSVGHLGYTPQFSVVVSQTAELLNRARKLSEAGASDAA